MKTWTKHSMELFTPFKKLYGDNITAIIALQIMVTLLLWLSSESTYVPSLIGIVRETYKMVMEGDLVTNFTISVWLCTQSIFIASIVALLFAYASTLPFFSGISEFATKLRFLAPFGFGFLFMKISSSVHEQKMILMTFAISGFLIASMVSTIKEITTDDIDYCKVIGMGRWKMFRELVVYGKASDLYECIRQNFAIAWSILSMVENLAKSEGGIGVIMADKNRLFNFEGVYGIQILILLSGILIDYVLRCGSRFIFTYKNH